MAQPVYPIYPTPDFPNPKMIIRSRREIDTKDAINARQFEHWQTDGKHGIYNRPDLNSQAPFYDTLPISSRMNENNYLSQPRFDIHSHKGGQNSYFDKYDTVYDARNTIRELKAVVYEDKNIGYTAEDNHLLQRNFDNRWMDNNRISEQINASSEMRLKMDDIRKFYK